MPKRVLVVGAGLSGLMAAYHLGRMGVSVQVLALGEPKASLAAQGIVSSKGLHNAHSPLFQAKIKGMIYLREWLRSEPRFAHKLFGCLAPYRGEGDFKGELDRAFHGSLLGLYGVRHLGKSRIPLVLREAGFQGAMEYPSDFWVSVPEWLAFLRDEITSFGGSFFTGGFLDLVEGRLPTLKVGDFSHLVLATGPSLSEHLTGLGVSHPPLVAVYGQSLVVAAEGEDFAFLFGPKAGVMFRGQLRFGASHHNRCGGLAQTEKEEDLEKLRATLPFPIRQQGGVEGREGVRIRTRDRMPIWGLMREATASFPAVWALGALYKNGLQLSPLLGKALAEAICDRPLNPVGT